MCYTKNNLIEAVIDDLKENYESIVVRTGCNPGTKGFHILLG